jgi:hypothetical protein
MAATRLADDVGAYRKVLRQSSDQLSYVLDPNRFEHSNRCRIELGLAGGNTVSTFSGRTLVETESELMNITEPASRDRRIRRKFDKLERDHLPTCQLATYKNVPGADWVPSSIARSDHRG